jgi:hypothetical protein
MTDSSPNQTRKAALRTHGSLSGLAVLSYFTTALRDVYLVAQANRSDVIDNAVLSVAVGATLAAVLGLTGLLLHSAGRSLGTPVRGLLVAAAGGIALLNAVPIVALAVIVASSATLFHVGQAFAADQGKLLHVSFFNTFSSFATIAVWVVNGTETTQSLGLGFAAGTFIQAGAALFYGRKHWLRPSIQSRKTDQADVQAALSLALPAQLIWLLARVPYLGTAPGQLTSASLMLTLVFSITIALASPSVYLDIAGNRGIGKRLMSHLSYVAGAGLFVASGIAAVFAGQFPVSDALQQTIRMAGQHGLILTVVSPAITYLYIRVRQSDPISGTGLNRDVLYLSLAIQLATIGLTRIVEVPPALIGIGFVVSQWVAVVLDKRRASSIPASPEAGYVPIHDR